MAEVILPWHVAALVLCAALMHATWNAIVKSSANKLLDTVTLSIAAGLISVLLLPFLPQPSREAWPWLLASVVLHVIYFLTLAAAYRRGDLSHAYPLMRGTAPMLVALAGIFLLEDRLTAGMWTGIALISAGILTPVVWQPRVVSGQATLIALGNAVVIAAYSIVDGFGTRASGQPGSYCLWIFVLDLLPIVLVAAAIHGRETASYALRRWRAGTVGALCTLASYGIVLWAMTIAPIAAVAALRETSVIFAAIIGVTLLKEKLGRVRIAGAILVVCGIVALRM
jgi:drug/metabolite transporter (DMT)-like permease